MSLFSVAACSISIVVSSSVDVYMNVNDKHNNNYYT